MTGPQEDTLVRHARREALAAFLMWLAAMIYSISYCYTFGYGRSADSLSFVLRECSGIGTVTCPAFPNSAWSGGAGLFPSHWPCRF